jgi:hypothetical protein
MPTGETSPETSEVNADIDDADIPESVKAVVQDLNARFEESTNPTFGEPATGGINIVQLLLEMKQDLAVNQLEFKQEVAGIRDELMNKMVENEAKVEKTLEQVTTEAAARETRALEWQEKIELEMKARDERWHGELEEYYDKRVATVQSEILVEVYKTVSEEGQAVRAEIRGEVSAAGEKVKDELRQELTQVIGTSMEQIQLDKATLLETVKLQTAEVIQDEIMKIKEEYANVSTQVVQMHL